MCSLATLERCFSCFNNLQPREPTAKEKEKDAHSSADGPGANGIVNFVPVRHLYFVHVSTLRSLAALLLLSILKIVKTVYTELCTVQSTV